MPPMNLTNTVADPEGLILAQMDRERDPVESENPNEQISEAVAPPSSKSAEEPVMSPQDLQEAVLEFRQDVRRRIEELKRMIEERALELAQRSQRPLDEIRHLLTVRDGDEDADINIRLLLGLNQSACDTTRSIDCILPWRHSTAPGSQAHRLQRLPLDQLHIPTVPHPQLPFWTMIKRYLNTPTAAKRLVSQPSKEPYETPIRSRPKPYMGADGNEKAVMHYGELYERMTEARYGWRLMGWPDGVLLEPPAQMLAGGSGAAQMLWKRLDSGTCYWEKLPDAEYHALREKYQGFKRVKVEKGEVQEHHDGPRSSTLGKRRRYLPRNEVDHSTSHESTVPKGRGGTARQPAKRCRASPEAPPSRKLNSALSDQPQAISVTRVSTRNSPGGIKIKIPRRSPKRLSQIHGASSDCDSDESG
ncbi:hypothetical protein B0H14DRAFT_2603984 [Mycena olivaceomarginata]|nr:hypothetical protein B0H14DRAFT_2603984 [Mycena olivaceomarginata]